MTASEPLVRTQRDGHVLVISINREAKRNAIDRATADALDVALNTLDDDPDIRVGVLTGTATVFSAGSDLKANGDYNTDRGGEYAIIRRRRLKPLIAAVEGPALGGGMEIALACDLIVASSASRFGLPEVGIGVIARCGGLFRTQRAVPLNIAREIMLTGLPISSPRAYELGLVNLVTAPGGALAGALDLAKRIAANSPVAVQASLRAVNELTEAIDQLAWAATERASLVIQGSDDAKEGVRSFFERRPPVCTGK
jgi:enoyl-CoA hydratase